jgi:putative SOS response-associated peptidase YedK
LFAGGPVSARLCAPNDLAELKRELGSFTAAPNVIGSPCWNVSANHAVPVLTFDRVAILRRLSRMQWGLVAARAKNTLVLQLTEDCRQQVVSSRGRWAARRCLIPVRHYYEWRRQDRQPFAIGLSDRHLMTLAGLWEGRADIGQSDARFLILTTGPNHLIANICSRMPVIIPPQSREEWLCCEPSGTARLTNLFTPFPADKMVCWPVRPGLRDRNHDAPDIAEEWTQPPLPPDQRQQQGNRQQRGHGLPKA